jgi:predicted PurR-regulated permease PerM
MSINIERAREDEADGIPIVRLSRKDRHAIALNGLFILACLFTLYFAASLLLPIIVALLISILLAPIVRWASDIGIPEPLAAALIVVTLVSGFAVAVLVLSGPAQDWFERIPSNFYRLESKLRSLKQPLENIQSATEKLQSATDVQNTRPLEVKVERPGIIEQLLTGTPRVLASTGMVILLLFLLLASGDTFLRKLVSVAPALEDKKRAVEITRSIQNDISLYLGSLTLLNLTIGGAIALICWLSGVEHPVLWGTMTFLLSFAPYAGSAAIFVILAFVGLLSFSQWTWALFPALSYIVLMFVSGNIVIPLLVGRRLTLSPLAIFISIIFWGWMWGVIGALVAVPLLASFKIICQRIDPLKPIAEFLTP